MSYDYYEDEPFTVYDLVKRLQQIVADNPDVDFHRVSISMNNEYQCNEAVLEKWVYKGAPRVCINLDP